MKMIYFAVILVSAVLGFEFTFLMLETTLNSRTVLAVNIFFTALHDTLTLAFVVAGVSSRFPGRLQNFFYT